MLDEHHNTTNNTDQNWKEKLTSGDIVLFPFPSPRAVEHEQYPNSSDYGPCLVVEIESKAGDRFATIIQGIDEVYDRLEDLDLDVSDVDALTIAGLDRPTRFLGDHRLKVNLKNEAFGNFGNSSPVIGHLDANNRKRLALLRKTIRTNIVEALSYRAHKPTFLVHHVLDQLGSIKPKVVISSDTLRGRIRPIKLS